MSSITVNGSALGTPLQSILMSDAISPGSDVSYQLCKILYTYHPLGLKMAETPIKIAQSQRREIAIQMGPEEKLREAFDKEWDAIGADRHILNAMTLARVYGISSIAAMEEGKSTDAPLDFKNLWRADITFNTLDPLNTAGSLVLSQDPNALDFQHVQNIYVQGRLYHRSRTRTVMNERPIYIEYTASSFGYVGRSVYQRALFPMKTYIRTMVTDDMVARKAGLLVAMMKAPGSIINRFMEAVAGIKRNLLKQGEVDNVLEIGSEDKIESLDLHNLEGPSAAARKNCIENTATAADMPAKLLLQESFAEGFGEGTEDAKYVASYIDGVRIEARSLYEFFDEIVMWRAWNPEYYKTIQAQFPEEYGDVDFQTAFYQWKNSFAYKWPSLITEPDSEKIKVDDVKLKAVISLLEVFLPELPPEEKANLITWACDNFNQLKLMFGSQLTLDAKAIAEYEKPVPAGLPGDAPSEARIADAMTKLSGAVSRLPVRSDKQKRIAAL